MPLQPVRLSGFSRNLEDVVLFFFQVAAATVATDSAAAAITSADDFLPMILLLLLMPLMPLLLLLLLLLRFLLRERRIPEEKTTGVGLGVDDEDAVADAPLLHSSDTDSSSAASHSSNSSLVDGAFLQLALKWPDASQKMQGSPEQGPLRATWP